MDSRPVEDSCRLNSAKGIDFRGRNVSRRRVAMQTNRRQNDGESWRGGRYGSAGGWAEGRWREIEWVKSECEMMEFGMDRVGID